MLTSKLIYPLAKLSSSFGLKSYIKQSKVKNQLTLSLAVMKGIDTLSVELPTFIQYGWLKTLLSKIVHCPQRARDRNFSEFSDKEGVYYHQN